MEYRHDDEQSLACRALEAHVDRMGVRLPEFADPEAWFLMMENNFRAAGVVADLSKYMYVVTAVASRHIDQLRDILTHPSTEHQYAFLKAEVIRRLDQAREHKRLFLEGEEMGDRRPSHFLRRLRNLAGDMANEELLRTVWLGRLPASLRVQLADRTDYHLDRLAETADLIMDATQATAPRIAETAKPPWKSDVEQNTDRIAALEEKMQSVEAVGGPRGGKSNAQRYARPRPRPQPRPRSGDPAADGVCWYHRKFGSTARRCELPCSARQSAGNATAHH